MKQWGIFATDKEVSTMTETVKQNGFDVFEVRELTFIEKLIYVQDVRLFVNNPHIIMFYATEDEYNSLIRKMKLTPVF